MENEQPQVVTISKDEYEQLRQNAAPTVSATTYGASYNTEQKLTKTTASEKVWFGLAVAVLISMIFPIGWLFFIPIVAFAFLAARGALKDNSDHSAPVKGAVLVFKVLAIIAISCLVSIGAMVALFIAMLSTSGGHF